MYYDLFDHDTSTSWIHLVNFPAFTVIVTLNLVNLKKNPQQIHNKSNAYNKSTTSLNVEMLWICCGFVVDF